MSVTPGLCYTPPGELPAVRQLQKMRGARMRVIVLLLVVVFCPFVSFAQDIEDAKLAKAHEFTNCAGYYFALATKDGKASTSTEPSKAFQEKGKQAIEIAKKYVPDEQKLGKMVTDAFAYIVYIAAQSQSGWEKLIEANEKPCKSILENP